MKDIKQIYRDKTGWREINKYPMWYDQYRDLENLIGYYEFPNAPDTNEIVEAYLQWQEHLPFFKQDEWVACEIDGYDPILTTGAIHRCVWVLANTQSPSAPKVEASATKRISKDDIIYPLKAYLAYPGIPDYLRDIVTVENCKKAMEQYAALKTKQVSDFNDFLQQGNDEQLVEIAQLQSKLNDKEKENERLNQQLEEYRSNLKALVQEIIEQTKKH